MGSQEKVTLPAGGRFALSAGVNRRTQVSGVALGTAVGAGVRVATGASELSVMMGVRARVAVGAGGWSGRLQAARAALPSPRRASLKMRRRKHSRLPDIRFPLHGIIHAL